MSVCVTDEHFVDDVCACRYTLSCSFFELLSLSLSLAMNDIVPNEHILAIQAQRNTVLQEQTLRYYNMFIDGLNKQLTEIMTGFPYTVDLTVYGTAPPSCHVAWTRFIERVRQQFLITNVTAERRVSGRPYDNDEVVHFGFDITDYVRATTRTETGSPGTHHRDMAIKALAAEGIENPTRDQIVAAMNHHYKAFSGDNQ